MKATRRTITLLIAAVLLYFFANQTQIGWLYVMSALLAGIVGSAALLNRGMLKGIRGERMLSREEIHEGEPVSVRLSLTHERGIGAAQVQTTEICPLADPQSAEHRIPVFVPFLQRGREAAFTYEVPAYRRGLHRFPALQLLTRAPFGFFETVCTMDVATRLLVYPEVKPLPQLSLLDRRPASQQSRPRAGLGSEVLGVRPFRTGDSPRHVHWRSVARTGRMISKEYVDEAHPGLTLALDLFAHPYATSPTKHTPFEWGIKAAASIAEYARRRGYALHVLADTSALTPPPGPVSWEALLQYLARVEPEGARPLGAVIPGQPVETFLAAVLPWPDHRIIEPLVALRNQGVDTLAVVLDPASFPAGGSSGAPLADALRAVGVETSLLRFGADWVEQLTGAGEREMRVGVRI